MRAIETLSVRGLTVNIYQDEDAQSPEEWGNDDLYLLAWHRAFEVTRPGFKRPDDVLEYANDDDCDDDRVIKASIRADYHVFPLTAYIHSGVALYLGNAALAHDPGGWDTSRVGIVLVSRAEWGDEDAARKAAVSLVEEWNQYLSGDVYGYVVQDEEGHEVESCWGFYGIDAVKDEARGVAKACADKRDEEQARDLLNDNDPRCYLATVPGDDDCASE
jgi:hypothetical protein